MHRMIFRDGGADVIFIPSNQHHLANVKSPSLTGISDQGLKFKECNFMAVFLSMVLSSFNANLP